MSKPSFDVGIKIEAKMYSCNDKQLEIIKKHIQQNIKILKIPGKYLDVINIFVRRIKNPKSKI